MSSNSDLANFAARLRRFIHASVSSAPAERFDSLALDLFALQFKHNPPYRRVCDARGARPETIAHWSEVPALPTSAFKDLAFSCLPVEERVVVFHSSGTTERRPSRHFHSPESLGIYEASLWAWFAQHFRLCAPGAGAGESLPTAHDKVAGPGWQLVIVTPPPAEAPHSSLVHMFDVIRRRLGFSESVFLAEASADGWTLHPAAAVERIRGACSAAQPLVILGTAFSFVHLLDHLGEHELRFRLPPGSCALETGGYKGRSRALVKTELHGLITRRLGLPACQIVCEYGMSELSSQAYDVRITSCPTTTENTKRRFRFPPWVRVQIISPETGREAAEGEKGLIRVFDLANLYSVMGVQTEDLAVRCADGFELIGRAAPAEVRGCSLAVAP